MLVSRVACCDSRWTDGNYIEGGGGGGGGGHSTAHLEALSCILFLHDVYMT